MTAPADHVIRLTELRLKLDHTPAELAAAIPLTLGVAAADVLDFTIIRRGHDARGRGGIRLVYTLEVRLCAGVTPKPNRHVLAPIDRSWRPNALAPAHHTDRPIVIGAGPCGLLAALTLAEMGFRPIILERGRMVRERTRDTWALWRRGALNPESNAQFGEGGAGTFSDGKLHSGIKDPRHLGHRVLRVFAEAGAPEEILHVSKPHIGTFRLVTVVENLRARIEALGGEYRFGARVEAPLIEAAADGSRHVVGVALADGGTLAARQVVLAIGHSARDTMAALVQRGVAMAPKPFSIGFRIEHPQAVIDAARWGAAGRPALLGSADYKLVHHASNGRSVYSFCMCPGGRVVAATTEVGRVVTNGMSQYSRAEFNANAGIVVAITPADFPPGILGGVALQRDLESRAFQAGGGGFAAPAQRVGDFLAGVASRGLGAVAPSYQPGVTPTDLAPILPPYASVAIREALGAFDAAIPGFAMPDAMLTGVETRTSSPVRIARGADGQSVNTRGLFPAGEGAGYAGGILSAAVDGIRVAEALAAAVSGIAPPEPMVRADALIYG
jgi:uncharacterized FAD-dependent dehydrogenase